MFNKMKRSRILTERDVHLLKEGDQLILDIVHGSREFRQNTSRITGELQRHGLKDGEKYTFQKRNPLYKPGEGTILGWYIDVREQSGDPRVHFQYYRLTSDLEDRLEKR